MFLKENLNPKDKKTGDCVIRAIAKAEGKSWISVFEALTIIARRNFSLPDCRDCYAKYLKDYETVNVFHMVQGSQIKCVNGIQTITEEHKKRYTVDDICEWHGTYIVAVANHLTCVIDGTIYDTWNCGNKSAYKIWRVK